MATSPRGWAYAAGRRHNLPAQVSSFVGRADEISALKRLFGRTRLVTLTGTGGVGKTRLALELSAQLVEYFDSGVWLVELAGLADAELVPQAVAAALGIPGQAGRSIAESVASAIANHRLLFVIDNCEHLLDACALFVHELLRTCPNLHVLATSRAPLGIAGEHAWPVPSLSLPANVARAAEAESVQLFIDRLAAVMPRFSLQAENAAAVAEVCTRLDGIPLALELAAARGNVLSPNEIARRLDDRFSLLVHADRTAPRRHHTLRAALAWSYDLLAPREQIFFDRLSVFQGGWTLEAAEAVCMADELDGGQTLELLTQLVAKSMIVVEQGRHQTRYRLLEMLREYATERLTERGELEILRDRHAAYFRAFAERAEPGTWGPDAQQWWQRLEDDVHNLRAALRRLIDRDNVGDAQRLGGALVRFWQTQIYIGEGRTWLAELLALRTIPMRTANRATLLAGAGQLASFQGDLVLGRAARKESIDMASEVGDALTLATALFYGAQGYWWSGDYATARSTAERGVQVSHMAGHETLEGQCNYVLGGVDYELGAFVEARATLAEALRLYTRVGYVRGLAVAFQQLGRVTYREGELAEARRLMEESIGYFRNAAWPYGIAWDLITLGWIATDQGQPDHARACLTESLRLFGEIGAKSRMIECLEGFAQLEIALGRPERGLRLASACAALRLALGVALSPGERGALEPRIQRGQAALGRASGAAWAVGQRLSLDEAIAFALAAPPAKPPADPPEVFALTRREHQVAHLVAQGRTSRQIAEELIVAERTVETHLERIYAKLDVHSRVQLASWLTAHRPSVPQSSSTA